MASKVDLSAPLLAFSILLSLLLPSPIFAAVDSAVGESLLTKTCNATKYPDICISTLKKDPRSLTQNLTGFSKIAIEISASKVNDTYFYIGEWVQNATNYETWGFLVLCHDIYNASLYRIKDEWIPRFEEHKYEDAYKSVEIVNKEFTQCNNDKILWMLKERNTFLYKFTADIKGLLHLLF